MDYRIIEKTDIKYIEFARDTVSLSSEADILDIISTSLENSNYYVALHYEGISNEFFNLKSGFAGEVLQKFVNYGVRAAIIINNEEGLEIRFKEMLSEANKGNQYGFFRDISEAEEWFLSLN